MLNWIDDLSDEMVIEALRRALDRNKPSWGYAKSILQSWANKKISTLDQAKAEEVEFQNQQSSKRNNYQNQSQEVVPDWFNSRKQAKENQQQNQGNNQEFNELLREFTQAGGDG